MLGIMLCQILATTALADWTNLIPVFDCRHFSRKFHFRQRSEVEWPRYHESHSIHRFRHFRRCIRSRRFAATATRRTRIHVLYIAR